MSSRFISLKLRRMLRTGPPVQSMHTRQSASFESKASPKNDDHSMDTCPAGRPVEPARLHNRAVERLVSPGWSRTTPLPSHRWRRCAFQSLVDSRPNACRTCGSAPTASRLLSPPLTSHRWLRSVFQKHDHSWTQGQTPLEPAGLHNRAVERSLSSHPCHRKECLGHKRKNEECRSALRTHWSITYFWAVRFSAWRGRGHEWDN